jgi:membrane-associated phospholipid phosphatase
MQLFRIAAFVLFVIAACVGIGLGTHWDVDTLLGLIAAGLACLAASGFTPPAPPSR